MICCKGVKAFELFNCLFNNGIAEKMSNSNGGDGGMLYLEKVGVKIKACQFVSSTCDGKGGF
jgi:hypothetical protein